VTFGFVDRGGSSVELVWARFQLQTGAGARLGSAGLRPRRLPCCCPPLLPPVSHLVGLQRHQTRSPSSAEMRFESGALNRTQHSVERYL